MKKILYTITVLLTALSLHASEPGEQDYSFSLCTIFSYKHPVVKTAEEKKWTLNLSGNYIENRGNTDSIDVNYSAFMKFNNNIMTFKTAFSGFYGKTGGVKDEDRGTGSANFDYYLIGRIEFFSYTMSEYNKMIELKHRNNSGMGFKIVFVRNCSLLIDLSGAPILQYEKYGYQDSSRDWRWSARGRIEIAPFNPDFSIRYYAYYIPSMRDRHNYRTIHDLSLYKRLIGSVGIRAVYRREYNTYDDEILAGNSGIKKTDSLLYFQLSVTI